MSFKRHKKVPRAFGARTGQKGKAKQSPTNGNQALHVICVIYHSTIALPCVLACTSVSLGQFETGSVPVREP